MTHSKYLTRMKYDYKQITLYIFLCIVLESAYLYYALTINQEMQSFYNLSTSVADSFCFLHECKIFPIINIIVIVTGMFLFKTDFDANRILRNRKKESVYFYQCMKAFVYSLIFSLYILVLGCIISFQKFKCLYNWSTTDSNFFRATKTVAHFGFTPVIIAFFLTTFFTFLLTFLILILLYWLTNKLWVGISVAIILCFIERKVPLFFGQYALYNCIFKHNYLKTYFILPMATIIILIAIQSIVIRRKEFLDAKKQ
ncbi:hypothetical protein RBG61_09355 [Paludicola sp. MB14-C6]|uniref:hypothetical protein n=1 Tax=Paludihabitans sp. MB14-C6 TaxID=3070656 RepID=UPI0027DB24DB|nr:hypothetical protein [Paludicola sp. MB14-C6]WMJ22203.1 hypothetical protein RBG61_09355 [Paludicola sp. MB14-C6]